MIVQLPACRRHESDRRDLSETRGLGFTLASSLSIGRNRSGQTRYVLITSATTTSGLNQSDSRDLLRARTSDLHRQVVWPVKPPCHSKVHTDLQQLDPCGSRKRSSQAAQTHLTILPSCIPQSNPARPPWVGMLN